LPHVGTLTQPTQLPATGPGYQWLDPSGHHYGTDNLVALIQHAAATVQLLRPDSEPLRVGDLSAHAGGKLRNHASHRTGRDADLLFFITTLDGRPIPTMGWVKFGPDGLGLAHGRGGHGYVQFDLERNWLLVKALMTSPQADVMWLFVSRPIEALLTEYALARGEDPELVWHAESLMLQPRNALPHDDHFHLRIACSPEATVQGCEDSNPRWPWLPPLPALRTPERDEGWLAWLSGDPAAPFPPPAIEPRKGAEHR
jgi:penicillin-insensitive murein DD-endopeptidase